jgi:archaeal flagellin FlaB
MPKFCPNCGEEISEKVKFCPKCGVDIDSFSVKKEEKSNVEEPKKEIKIDKSQKIEETKIENKKSGNGYPIWVYGVIIVAIIIVLYAAISMFSAFSAGMNQNIKSSPIITSAPTIVSTAQMVITTTPTTALPTLQTTPRVDSSSANIQMIGNVYGLATTPAAGIDQITFVIGLTPGAPPIDLTKMKIIFTKSGSAPMILLQGDTASKTIFTTKIGTTQVTSMNPNDQVEIYFGVANMGPNTKMNIELRPSIGAALPFSKTAPATISKVNVLY